MKNAKRFLVLLLTGIITLTSTPVNVAADEITIEDTAIKTEISAADTNFYTTPEYIRENDPGVIYPPDFEIGYTTTENDVSNDGESQIASESEWPNTRLNAEQRQYVINRCKEIVAENLTEDMCDLEKYWTLAKWISLNVKYPSLTGEWYLNNIYNTETTPHGAHGSLKYGYGVCQGMTLLYMCLCHAADLPCDAICTPEHKHILNYIPNINGHSYYVDCTVNCFLASDDEWSGGLDKNGKDIVCDDHNYELLNGFNGHYDSITLDWTPTYDYYINLLNDPMSTGIFASVTSVHKYIENGSETPGIHYAHYADYALQNNSNTGNWELDDFFRYPKNVVPKEEWIDIKDAEISGLKDSYRFEIESDYRDCIASDMIVTVNGERLQQYEDYTVELQWVNSVGGCVKVIGAGDDYNGSHYSKYIGCKAVEFKVTQDDEPGPSPAPTPDPAPTPVPEDKTLSENMVTGGKITVPEIAKTAADGKNYRIVCDKNIATVNNKGVIQGKKAGKTNATIFKADGTYHVEITVTAPAFSEKSFTKNTGDEFECGFDANGLDVIYYSDKPGIANIDEFGHVTAIKKGSAKITALVQGKKFTANVKVYDPMVVAKNTVLFTDGKTSSLSVKNGNGKTQWRSSDDSVVTVNNGKIKGISKGVATVTAINNGREMPVEITVYNIPKFEKPLYETGVEETITVALTKDDELEGVIYSVSNTKIANIDQNGVVTPLKKGNVTVSAKVAGKTFKTKVKIN